MERAWFHERLTLYITRSITSRNVYIDASILAVLWPVRTESIHLRPSAVLSRDPRPTYGALLIEPRNHVMTYILRRGGSGRYSPFCSRRPLLCFCTKPSIRINSSYTLDHSWKGRKIFLAA